MATHCESRDIARSPEWLFDIVADVERYPEFLPLISAAKIVKHHENAYETEQSLALGLMTYRFCSRTELDRPRSITVVSGDRSFRRFEIRWSFTPLAEDRCHVDFSLDCEARSLFLIPVIQVLIMPMATSMVSAFEARAHALAVAGCPETRQDNQGNAGNAE